MTKWIADGSLTLREVHGTRTEQHNSINGSPTMNVRLSVAPANLKTALAKLLGGPEIWPLPTVFEGALPELVQRPYVISATVSQNPNKGTTDGDAEIITYDLTFLDVTYAVRHGVYTIDKLGASVYIDSVILPHPESHTINHRELIWGRQDGQMPSDTTRIVTPDEAPVKYEMVETLIYTIEGWVNGTSNLDAIIGTVNDTAFTSGILFRTFGEGTLLLRNVEIDSQFSFISYRLPNASPTVSIDYSGRPTPMLRLFYEYKEQGWQKFWRVDSSAGPYGTAGYYYMRYAQQHGIYEPFPAADHTDYLLF